VCGACRACIKTYESPLDALNEETQKVITTYGVKIDQAPVGKGILKAKDGSVLFFDKTPTTITIRHFTTEEEPVSESETLTVETPTQSLSSSLEPKTKSPKLIQANGPDIFDVPAPLPEKTHTPYVGEPPKTISTLDMHANQPRKDIEINLTTENPSKDESKLSLASPTQDHAREVHQSFQQFLDSQQMPTPIEEIQVDTSATTQKDIPSVQISMISIPETPQEMISTFTVSPDQAVDFRLQVNESQMVPQEKITKLVETHTEARHELFEILTILSGEAPQSDTSKDETQQKHTTASNTPLEIDIPNHEPSIVRQLLIASHAKTEHVSGEFDVSHSHDKGSTHTHTEHFILEDTKQKYTITLVTTEGKKTTLIMPKEAKELIIKRVEKIITSQSFEKSEYEGAQEEIYVSPTPITKVQPNDTSIFHLMWLWIASTLEELSYKNIFEGRHHVLQHAS
jgi:hypothetical protein